MKTLIAPTPARTSKIASRPSTSALDVEIVVPVYNEERALAASVYRLHGFLSRKLPFSWQITVADNASTDATPEIASAIASGLDHVATLHLEEKGRGRALRAAWSASRAASWPTWTLIYQPICERCFHSSLPCSLATVRSPSAHDSCRVRGSCAAPSGR